MSKQKWNNYKSKTNQVKNLFFNLRLSPTEKEMLLKKAKETELLVSEYILAKTIYTDNTAIIMNADVLRSLQTDLNKLGNNYNQAIKDLHVAMNVAEINPEFSKEKLNNALLITKNENKLRTNLLKKIDTNLNRMYQLK